MMSPADVPAFEVDPYRRSLDTTVIDVGQEDGAFWAVCADTVLYPEGGGQPSDRGLLGGVEVLHVSRADGVIRHEVRTPVDLGRVRIELDWDRRFDHMQQHTAQHALTAVADSVFGWPTTAFHLGAEVSDVELDVADLDRTDLDRLESEIAERLRAGLTVTARRVPRGSLDMSAIRSRGLPADLEGDVRLVEIEGLDLNTCGGTHVRSLTEIGCVALIGTDRLRGGTRVFFVAGDRVRQRLRDHELRTAELRTLLGAPDVELVETTAAKLDQLNAVSRDRRRVTTELADTAAEALAQSEGPFVAGHWQHHDSAFLQLLARRFLQCAPRKAALLTAGEGPVGFFVVAVGDDSVVTARSAGEKVAEILEGRGGRSGSVFQGRANRLERRDEAAHALAQLLSG